MDKYTCRRSSLNPVYFVILLNGRAWRICHATQIKQRMQELNGS